MPISIQCPHCQKAYKLRDELAGKRVTCANPDCRKLFPVPGASPAPAAVAPAAKTASPVAPKAAPTASAKPAPAGKAPAPTAAAPPAKKAAPPKKPAKTQNPELDAESIAAAAFLDDAEAAAKAVPEDLRVIDVTCAMCDHKWTEPFAKQGKIALCPECKHRQKVPELKKAKAIDWRDPTANRPTLAKGEEIPDDLKEQQVRQVTLESLEQAGAIEAEEVEPRPLKQKIAIGLGLAGVLCSLAFGVFFYFKSRSESKELQFMPDALKEVAALSDEELPKGQGPLIRGVLFMSAGEHTARFGMKGKRDEAIKHFTTARSEWESIPKSLERDLLLGEMALALLPLGGTEEQANAETHIRWTPPIVQGNRPRINADATTVQAELRRILAALRKEGQGADFDVRASIARRLGVALAKRGQFDLFDEILGQGFSDAELPEAQAQVALEMHRAGVGSDKVLALADQIKNTLQANPGSANPLPISAKVLWQVVDPPITDGPSLVGAPGSGDVSLNARMAYALLAACKDDAAGAAEVAARPGLTQDRIKALAYAAEFSKDPTPILNTAFDVMTKDTRPDWKNPSQYALVRLAQIAGRSKDLDKANAFAAAIPDAAVKVYAKADALRWKLASAGSEKVDLKAVEVPDSATDLKAGHAWACTSVARHNGNASGDTSAAKSFADWGKQLRPFGLAGLALGLQDRNAK